MIEKYFKKLEMHKVKKKRYQNSLANIQRINSFDSSDRLKFTTHYNDEYALSVNLHPYSRSYIKKARQIIEHACSVLHDELKKEPNKLGLCIQVSKMLSSILNKEGIKNYLVSGKVRIDFADELKLRTIHPDRPPFDDGHVWVVAPPYGVIDLTIKYQNYNHGVQDYLPDWIMYETKKWYEYSEDLPFFELPSYAVMHNDNVEVCYLSGIGNGKVICNENELPSNRSYTLNGKDIQEIYNTLIQPKIAR